MTPTTQTAETSSPLTSSQSDNALALANIMPIVIIFIIFYFLLIRPQQRKLKEHQAMIKSLRRGDKIVTAGGVIGTISKIEADENILEVEIAPSTRVKIMRGTIHQVLSHPQPAGKEEKE